jgi:hypothetical protein
MNQQFGPLLYTISVWAFPAPWGCFQKRSLPRLPVRLTSERRWLHSRRAGPFATDRFYRRSDVVLVRVLMDRNKLAISRRFAAASAE